CNASLVVPSVPNAAVSLWRFPNFQLIAQIAGVVILAGIATRFAVLVLGLLKLRQFRKASSSIARFFEMTALLDQVRSELKVRADFRLSPDVHSPVTFGFARPLILLPEKLPSLDSRFQTAIADHELLHVRRRDWVYHLAEEIIRSMVICW